MRVWISQEIGGGAEKTDMGPYPGTPKTGVTFDVSMRFFFGGRAARSHIARSNPRKEFRINEGDAQS